MGLARAAELNSYPGPMHVLELADRLALTEDQRAATQALMARMRSEAQRVGAAIIAAEQTLDRDFARAASTTRPCAQSSPRSARSTASCASSTCARTLPRRRS